MAGLWKREAKNLYIDLFGSPRNAPKSTSDDYHRFLDLRVKPVKNNTMSKSFSDHGNFEFKSGHWLEAMEFYSKSLCFAEIGTDNVSLAYAHRSSCFFKMADYAKCIKDIDLAIAANYPERMLPIMLKRKADCEDSLKNQPPVEVFDPKLSFDRNELFPCMADVVKIHQNEKFGRHMVATADISVGKTILVEEAYVTIDSGFDRVNCYECLGAVKNFIACSNCTDVMFCDDECKNHSVHMHSCDVSVNRMSTGIRYIAKSIMIALVAFGNANELMEFIEDYLPKRSAHLPTAGNDPKSKYAIFISLQPKEGKLFNQNIHLTRKVFNGLMDVPLVKREFDTIEKQRFLMHLVGEHFLIIANNTFGGLSNSLSNGTTSLFLSLFNHACAPNVFNSSAGNKEVCITMRPIKKGEQLFIKYLTGNRTTRQRQELLLEQWNFLCECDKCNPACEHADRLRMRSDPLFKALPAPDLLECTGYQENSVLTAKCVKFLEKYGHLPWSEEMDVALKYYNQCLLDPFPLT